MIDKPTSMGNDLRNKQLVIIHLEAPVAPNFNEESEIVFHFSCNADVSMLEWT